MRRFQFPSHPLTNLDRQKTTTARLITSWIVAGLLIASVVSAASPGPGPEVGSNLGFLSNNSGEWPFVDVYKTASRWYISGDCGWDCGTLHVDANGWISDLEDNEYASTIIFTGVADKMPHGSGDSDKYVILYDGVGVLDYDGVSHVLSQSPGRDEVRIDPTSTQPFIITIVRTAETFDPAADAALGVTAADYVRNIRVLAPGGVCTGGSQDDPYATCMESSDCQATCSLFADNYATQIFHPDFLNNVRHYDLLRFMDWMDTIQSDVTNYASYPTETYARWNRAPASIMAELANRLEVDAWVNIPHLADQNFLDGFADDMANHLDPDLKLYVELSNELWNSAFPAYEQVAALECGNHIDLPGCAIDADTTSSVLCEGHGDAPIADCDTARMRYTSRRSIDAWLAFEAALDNDLPGSSDSRLVRVMGSWSGHPTLHEALLSYADAYAFADVLATAGYFGWVLGADPDVQSWQANDTDDMNTLFSRLALEVTDTLDDMYYDRLYLSQHTNPVYRSIEHVLYEGGQGIEAHGYNTVNSTRLAHANTIFDAANRDPRIGHLYQTLLDGWQLQGGTLFNHYQNCHVWDIYGRYGALEHQRQDHSTSYKYSTLKSFIQGLP